MTISPIGRRMLRVEDRPLLTGEAEFVDDLELDGMLHARFHRSPVAHARLVAVDLDAARAMPGVVAAYAAADHSLPPLHPPIENDDAWSPPRPLLAEERVRFVGAPIAVIVADSPYAAEDAADTVEATLDPLEAVVDPLLAPDAPPLHDHHTNVLFDTTLDVGEVDTAFAGAAVVVERTFRSPRYSATPMEMRAAVAAPDGEGGVCMWASTQIPHRLALLLAELLELPLERVRVAAMDVGGGFGQKAHAYPEEILTAWLAVELGRPVKWVEDRSENLQASSHARDQVVVVRAAADADGRLRALDADVICDVGAYGVFPHGHILEALGTPSMIPGPYRLEHYRARARAVCTNKGPEGAYRGVGLPVSTFVHERLMDVLAAELGLDPAEIRRRNYIRAEDLPHPTVTHHRYDSGDYTLALERALEASGELDGLRRDAEARGRCFGVGIGSYVEYTGMGSVVFHGRGMVGIPGHHPAWMRLAEDGCVTVWTTLPAIGQGVATTFAQLAAHGLGVPVEDVRVERSDTAAGPGGGTGTFASRSAVSGGGAVKAAAGDLRGRLLDAAAEHLEAARDDLELIDGTVSVRGSPSRGVSVRDLAAAADGDLEPFAVTAEFDPQRTVYPYATHVCALEVDPDTGDVDLLRYVVAEDCGTVINPQIVEGQAHGAIAQGIGGALYEALVYDDRGQLLTASLMDYLVPTAMELPSVEIDHLEIPSPDSVNGAKGVGEGGTLGPTAAIANAISDALGVECNALPLTPERVREAAAKEGNTRAQRGSSPDDGRGARPENAG